MKYEVDGKVFSTEEEAIRYCAEEGISTANITEIEEEEEATIEESPEENPDEDSEVIDEQELIDFSALSKIVEDWDLLTDTEKEEVVSVALGKETGHPKHFEEPTVLFKGKVKDPFIFKKDIGEALGKYHLRHMVSKIENGICPLCSEHYTQTKFYDNIDFPEELSDFWKPSTKATPENPSHFTKQAKAKSPEHITKEAKIKMVIHHMKVRHESYKKLAPIIEEIFEIPESYKMPRVERRFTQNPESCSDREELSKEDLAELTDKIASNTEEGKALRKQLFRKWKEARKSN